MDSLRLDERIVWTRRLPLVFSLHHWNFGRNRDTSRGVTSRSPSFRRCFLLDRGDGDRSSPFWMCVGNYFGGKIAGWTGRWRCLGCGRPRRVGGETRGVIEVWRGMLVVVVVDELAWLLFSVALRVIRRYCCGFKLLLLGATVVMISR